MVDNQLTALNVIISAEIFLGQATASAKAHRICTQIIRCLLLHLSNSGYRTLFQYFNL